MNSTPTLCPSSQIAAHLDAALPDDESKRFEEHLERCQTCRESLQLQAASKVTWDGANQYLLDDPDDLQRLSDGQGTTSVGSGFQQLLGELAPTDDPRMLGRLGPFEIAGVIGSGGMGVVLKAFDPALSRFVAMKVLSPHLWNDEQARQRFSREARAAASVIHDNVIEIYGVADSDGIPYFTMPYLRGETLQQRIDSRGPLELHEILRIAKQLADGLAAAHAQGLVHRDIKPANVLLTNGAERVRLSDFGLACSRTDDRLTHTDVLAGTPSFMSPEQVEGNRVDHRSDLFCLGSVIYAMCTAQSPFKADSVIQQLRKVSHASPHKLEELNPTIPTWLAAIVGRLHSVSPNDRYQSAVALAEDLEKCLAHSQNPDSCLQPRSVTKLQSRYERASRPSRIKSRIAGIGGLVAVALITWFGPGMWGQLVAQATNLPIAVEGQVVDVDGKPVAAAAVLAIQKTWPNSRYQQRSLKTITNDQGKFRFERFATQGKQYAFLLTVLTDGHSMTSEYRLVQDGKPQAPVTLRVELCKPISIQVKDLNGKPVPGVKLLPSSRTTASGKEYMTYAMQVSDAGKPTDENGIALLSGFQAGDKDARLTIDAGGEISQQKIEIPENRTLTITVTPPKPAGPAVTVRGKVVDADGKAVADAKVIVVRKTWPNNRYRQEGLSGQTNQDGEFTFAEFAPANRQYAFLLSVVEEGYAMTSEYRVVEDGSQQNPITLTVEPSEPITFVIRDNEGNPAIGVELCPNERSSSDGIPYINYHVNMKESSKKTDSDGKVVFTAWKPGETGKFHYRWQDKTGEIAFQVGDDRKVEITLR